MRRRVAAAAATLVVAGALAGCGGDAEVTGTTATEATTAAATTAPAPGTTAPAGTTDSLGEGLPAIDAVPGVGPADDRELDDAQEFVDALYQAGDPAKAAARARLEGAGYADGLLRDQTGTDPSAGIALLRTYVLALRDGDAAQREVDDAADEVVSASRAPSRAIEVPGIPGARAMRLDIDQGGVRGSVAFVTFAVGPRVYGIQGVASEGSLPQDELLQAGRDLHAEVSATP